jgi:hypothetical protein
MSNRTPNLAIDVRSDHAVPRGFMWVGISFIAFETLLITVFGDSFFSYSGIWTVVMFAVAGVGYFALGYRSGSWLSAGLLLVPLLVAAMVGGTQGPTVAYADGTIRHGLAFYQWWLLLSVVFVPLWALGVYVARRTLTAP